MRILRCELMVGTVVLSTPATRAKQAGGAGMFLVEPDRAERFIADMRAVADKAREARNLVRQARWDCPPEADEVRLNVAVQARKMSDNAVAAAERYRLVLIQVADDLQDQLAAYRRAEQENTPGGPA